MPISVCNERVLPVQRCWLKLRTGAGFLVERYLIYRFQHTHNDTFNNTHATHTFSTRPRFPYNIHDNPINVNLRLSASSR